MIAAFVGSNKEFGRYLREMRKQLNWGLTLMAEAAEPETEEPRTLRTREARKQIPEATTSVAENGGGCK